MLCSKLTNFQIFHAIFRSSYSLAVFQEPRGVMRILQLFFSICSFYSTTDFSVSLKVDCGSGPESQRSSDIEFEYPFKFAKKYCNNTQLLPLDVSSDAQFFAATGVLSILYAITIILVYVYFDDIYKRKPEFPMAVSFIR